MSETFTKSMARNIFYGGSVFFFLLFLALTFDTHKEWPNRDNYANMTEQAKEGKRLWEKNDCVGCHTLLGEGAYFAPELGNVYKRFANNKEVITAFIRMRPKDGIPGRRSMPQFDFNKEELDALAEFLKYVSGIDTENWPPNIQG